MKKILKSNFARLVLIFIFSLIFYDCQKDDLEEIKHNNKNIVKYQKHSDLLNNQTLARKIEKLTSSNNNDLQQRTIHNSQYGFSVDTDNFIYIGNQNSHSYTFNVYMDEEDQFTYNLLMQYNGNNNYVAFLVKYNLSEADKQAIKNGNTINNYSSKAEFAYLPEINSLFFQQQRLISYTSTNCTQNIVSQQTYINTETGTWETITYYTITCYDVQHYVEFGAGSGSTGTGGNGSTDGGVFNNGGSGDNNNNNNNNNTTEINTMPILNIVERKLAELVNRKNGVPNEIRNYIDTYVANINTYQVETGVDVRRGPNNTFIFNPAIEQGFDFVRFTPPYINSFLSIHVHHNFTNSNGKSLAQVPSQDDLFQFAKICDQFNNSTLAKEYSFMTITKNGIYVFKVNDISKLIEFKNAYINDKAFREEFRQAFDYNVITLGQKNAAKIHNTDPLNNNTPIPDALIESETHKMFVEFLLENPYTGIDVYLGNIEALSTNNDYFFVKLN